MSKLHAGPSWPLHPRVNLQGHTGLQVWSSVLQAVMQDPVIAADSHTYERAAIKAWLEQCQKSPVTGQQLKHTRLVNNFAIKSVISTLQNLQTEDFVRRILNAFGD